MYVAFVAVAVVGLAFGCDRTVAGGKADGAAIYRQVCAACHGSTGKPTPTLSAKYGVKDLTSAALHHRLSDEQIRDQIRLGSADKRMPAFGGTLTDDQLEAVVRHVRGLKGAPQ